MEDFEDVDESEIDGEERAHAKVNQIPNSQVNRNNATGPGNIVQPISLSYIAGGGRESRSVVGPYAQMGDNPHIGEPHSANLVGLSSDNS